MATKNFDEIAGNTPFYDDVTGTILSSLIFTNIIIVKSLNDLPTASGGKRILVANKTYWFDVSLNIGTDYLELSDGTSIRGGSSFNTVITYTGSGGAIRGIDGNMSISFLTINSPRAFDFSNAARDKNLVIQNCVIANQTSQSLITGYANSFLNIANYVNCVGGYNFTDNGFIIIFTQNFNTTNSGTHLTINPQNYTKVNISNSDFVVNTGSTGINVTSTNISLGILVGNTFSGTAPISNRLVGVNGITPNWTISFYDNIGIAGYQRVIIDMINTTDSSITTNFPSFVALPQRCTILDVTDYDPFATIIRVTALVRGQTTNGSNFYSALVERDGTTLITGSDGITVGTGAMIINRGTPIIINGNQTLSIGVARTAGQSTTVRSTQILLEIY